MKFKRYLSGFLAGLMLLSVFAFTSCSDSSGKGSGGGDTMSGNDTSPTDINTNPEDTTAEASIYDDVPTGSYGNYNFRMLNVISNYAYVLLTADELTGETINDAVYNRNLSVGERLGVTFTEEIVDWGSVISSKITTTVLSDEDAYDIMFDEVQSSIKYPSEKLMIDLNTVEKLDLSKPWWDAGSIETLSIGKSLYMVNGDIHLMYGESAWVLFVNKKLLADYSFESPYQLVLDGKWTLDVFNQMISQAARDLDGDSKMTNDDQFGLATHGDAALVMLTSSGEGLVYKNADNIPEWMDLPEKVYDISKRTHDTFFNTEYVYMSGTTASGTQNLDIVPHFMAGKSLFLCEVLGHAKTLRDMEDDFGILPTPKLDESQEDYCTFIARSAQTLMIPITNRDLDRTAVILENLGAESYKSVRPAYYDVQLSGKTVRDPDSLEMLNIIFSNRRYEMAFIFGASAAGTSYINATRNGSDLASAMASSSKSIRKSMEKILNPLIGE